MAPKAPSPPRFLPDLRMPLRDALRGVATVAGVTEDALAPAVQLLPEPVRLRLTEALGSLETAGRQLLHPAVDAHDLATTTAYLSGQTTELEARTTTAGVIVYAWDCLQAARPDLPHLISETLIAESLSRPVADPDPAGCAARRLADIRAGGAIGRAPGIAGAGSPREQTAIDHGLLAIGAWALAARADAVAAEAGLLDLAYALIEAMQVEPEHLFSDHDSLRKLLAETSAHL